MLSEKRKDWKIAGYGFCMLLLLAAIFMAGCGEKKEGYNPASRNSYSEHYSLKHGKREKMDYASDKDVDRVVKRHVTGERCTFCWKTEEPRGFRYHYRSENRDLEFDVLSQLNGYGGVVGGGASEQIQQVTVQYADGVRAYYSPWVEETLIASPVPSEDRKNRYSKTLYYSAEDELNAVAELLLSIDELYREETAYNSEAWMQKNPLYSFKIHHKTADGTITNVCIVEITGNHAHEDLRQYLKEQHAKYIVSSPTPPQDGGLHQ